MESRSCMRLTCCPHCGSNRGLYSIEQVRFDQYYTFSGEPNGYSEFSQIGTSARRMLTPLYCMICDRKVTTAEHLIWACDEENQSEKEMLENEDI